MKTYDTEAIEYIAKLAEGGLRDAVTMMDKCLAYSTELTVENVVEALGIADYDFYFDLTDAIFSGELDSAVEIIEMTYRSGKDLKNLVKGYCRFLIDLCKYEVGVDWQYISIPKTDEYVKLLKRYTANMVIDPRTLLSVFVELDSKMRYSVAPLRDVEVAVLLLGFGGDYK